MLLSSTQKIQVILAAAITTSQLPVVASWADVKDDASTLAPDTTATTTNSTTAVDVVAAPASGYKRQLKYLSIYNADTVAATVTVRLDVSGTARILAKIALPIGYRAEYEQGLGFRVLDTNGALVTTVSTLGGVISPVTALSSASGVLTINCALGNYFTVTLTENITSIVMQNVPASGWAETVMLRITQHASAAKTVAWPSSFKWPNTTEGVVSTALSAVDVLALTTFDQGARWEATLGKAFG